MRVERRAPDAARARRVDVVGCPIDALTMEEALERVTALVERRGFGQHMSVNAAKVVAASVDPELRAMIGRCDVVTADGQAVVWASRVLGEPLPERVAGIDLMEALLALAEERGWRVFVLGAEQEVLEQAVGRMRARHPRILVAGARDGYYSDAEEAAVVAEIARSGADVLFVGMSSPRKEYFLAAHGPALGVAFAMGVGGALDVVAGRRRRAPAALQRLGLEWLFRLVQEPRRLFRRYTETNLRFFALVARARARRHSRSGPPG